MCIRDSLYELLASVNAQSKRPALAAASARESSAPARSSWTSPPWVIATDGRPSLSTSGYPVGGGSGHRDAM
eukprot:8943731-Alexandrium_andersonii.AAC.1